MPAKKHAHPGAITLEHVGPNNLAACGIGCLANPKHEGFQPKVDWLDRRFGEGLRFLLFRSDTGKPLGFLEYVPGEYAWRPVDAAGWLFVHCLWVYPAGQRVGGLGGRLIHACIDRAKNVGATGVAAMVSDGPWMANKQIFLKQGFEQVDETDRFQLVVRRVQDGPDPHFRDLRQNLKRYRGLHVVYAPQCPFLPKSVNDLTEMASENGLELHVTVLDSARKAQRAPSYYGVFNLIWNGRILADHYVSKGRFKNMLRKDILEQ